jgi:hypothetical protein
MRRSMLTLALVSLCGLAVASVVGQRSGALPPLAVEPLQMRATPDQVMDGAVTAAVTAGVSRQFGESRVDVRLDRLDIQPASIRDRVVAGHGRIRLGQDRAWIPFRFEALYDTESAAVSAPRLALGQSHPLREVGSDSDIAHALAMRVDSALHDEFAQQPFELRIDRVVTQRAGEQLMQVRGQGTVDFGPDGAAGARIEALYDPVEARWLHVSYELGPAGDAEGSLQGPALAGRF